MKKFNADLYKVRARVKYGKVTDEWKEGYIIPGNFEYGEYDENGVLKTVGYPALITTKSGIYEVIGGEICRFTGKTDSFRRAVYEYDVIESVTVADGKKIVERYLVVWDIDLGGYVLISEGGDKCEFDSVGYRLVAGDSDERLFSAIDHREGLTSAQREYLK